MIDIHDNFMKCTFVPQTTKIQSFNFFQNVHLLWNKCILVAQLFKDGSCIGVGAQMTLSQIPFSVL